GRRRPVRAASRPRGRRPHPRSDARRIGRDGMASTTQLDDATLAELDERFEREPARTAIRWAVDTFHPRLCITASMTDAVLIDLAVQVEPSIEVVFIDTGYHFAETL